MNNEWKNLYIASAVAAFIIVIFIPLQGFIFIKFPPPSTIEGFFGLFHQNPVKGLLDLDLLLTVDNLLVVLIYLGFYMALKDTSKAAVLIATVFGLIAIVLFLVSREATFTIMSMSGKYFASSNEADKAQLLAAGRTLLEVYNGSCFDISYVLGGIVTLIFSVVMLRSAIFSRATGIIGLIMSVFMLVPPTVGPFGLFMSMLSLIPTMIWLILAGRGFLKLAGK